MNITVDKNLRTPCYWQIVTQIKDMILSGTIVDGAILPSERRMANILGVHRNTVIKAYSELKDQDFIESKIGVGYRVTYEKEVGTDIELKEDNKVRYKNRINWSQIIKDEYLDMEESFDNIFQRLGGEKNIAMAVGMPPLIYDDEEIARDLTDILAEDNKKIYYVSPYQGDVALRRELLAYLRTKGINGTPKEIQILSETNQAFDFILTALLKPGDCVFIEEPVSPDVYRLISLAGCKAVKLPLDSKGIKCGNIEPLIKKHNPKFIYVNSSFHDPTGTAMTLDRRKKLLNIAEEYRVPIIEDDSASELSFDGKPVPTIKSMDKNNTVVYIYSFALTFIPGLSIAFVLGPKELIKSLSYLVSVRLMSLDWTSQKLLVKVLKDGRYKKKCKELTKHNKMNMEIVSSYLDRLRPMGITYRKPTGGVYIWCKLPIGVDSKSFVDKAHKGGLSLINGDIFFPDKNGGRDYIRINYSYETKERIREGMKIFSKLMEETTNKI